MELAKAYFCQAVKLNPNNIRALYGLLLVSRNITTLHLYRLFQNGYWDTLYNKRMGNFLQISFLLFHRQQTILRHHRSARRLGRRK